MVNVVTGLGINEVVFKAIKKLKQDGVRTNTRNGVAYQLYNNVFNLKYPKNRHLNLKGRLNNIFATIAETFWVFAGYDDLTYLSFFLPRAYDFSDDGKTWYGGYGPRIYNALGLKRNQIKHVFSMFKLDNKYTRRATLYIGNVDDTIDAWQENKFEGLAKDQACNQVLNFYIDGFDKFNVNVMQRSGDILWGLGSVNIFEWSYLMEWLYLAVKYFYYPEIQLGEYYHFVTNAHLYDFNGEKQATNILENEIEQPFGVMNKRQLFEPNVFFKMNSVTEKDFPEFFKAFHEEIVKIYERVILPLQHEAIPEKIENRLFVADQILGSIKMRLKNDFYLSSEDLLYEYIFTIFAFGLSKCFKLSEKDKNKNRQNYWSIIFERHAYNDEFDLALKNSVFRNFGIKFSNEEWK